MPLPRLLCSAVMIGSLLAALGLTYLGVIGASYARRGARSLAYPSPEDAENEMLALAAAHPERCVVETIGRSTEGRPIRAFRLQGKVADGSPRPRLLITAQIHAIEFVGSWVARSVARRLLTGYGRRRHITELLDSADVVVVPLLNPDGAERVRRAHGWCTLGQARFTANGVDPNRNFPFVDRGGKRAWNTARDKPGSAYYRGPHPLSEPECLALARLCKRERFCAAVNFHSFSGVVFMPSLENGAEGHPDAMKAARAFGVFRDVFQEHQPHLRYKPVPERNTSIVGQLDPFLFEGLGAVSVTVEVSRPGASILLPWYVAPLFWWANPPRPQFWEDNDAEATVHALVALLERTAGTPCIAVHPELAAAVDEALASEGH